MCVGEGAPPDEATADASKTWPGRAGATLASARRVYTRVHPSSSDAIEDDHR